MHVFVYKNTKIGGMRMKSKKNVKSMLALLLIAVLVSQSLALAAPGGTSHGPSVSAAGTIVFEELFDVPESVVQEDVDDIWSHRDEIDYDHPALQPFIDEVSPVMAALAHIAATDTDSDVPHLWPSVVRSSGVPTGAPMAIDRVRIVDGGENQYRWRGQTGAGFSVYQGASGNWYTESRSASLDDRRVFYIHTQLTATQIAAITAGATIGVTYGETELSVWRGGNNTFTGTGAASDLIQLLGNVVFSNGDGAYTLETRLQFNSPYAAGTGINAPGNAAAGWRNFTQTGFPLAMRRVIGTFDVGISLNEAQIASMPLRLSLYDDFKTWNEIDQWAQDLRVEAGANRTINNRHVDVTVLGYSLLGRPIWNIAIAADQAAVDHYLNVTLPLMRENPEELRRQIEAGVHHRMAIYVTNIHPDEVSGVDAQHIMAEQLIRQEYIHFEYATDTRTVWTGWATNTNNSANRVQRNNTETNRVYMDVDAVLDDFIVLFTPTNNPDGREYLRRGNAYGFDLNRDGSSQVHQENRYMIAEILRWSPIIQLDLHGHVAALLIEPCTAPHNPNYEYDLMRPMMVRLAHAMGHAAIAGSYNRYMIPAVHRQEGWDDAGPLYLPVFMSHFGILGFTLEIPHANQESNDANVAMVYAAIHYAMNNMNDIVFNKLEQMHRGLYNIDARELVDPFLVDTSTFPQIPGIPAAGGPELINNPIAGAPPTGYAGRPRMYAPDHPQAINGYLDFFPDWWVIPADVAFQDNLTEAYRGVENLIRQQIRVHRLTSAVTDREGTTWPEGTFIINMRQALRGAAHTLLGYGYDASFSSTIYAGVLSAHPAARGFAATPLWDDGVFDGYLAPVTSDFTVPPSVIAVGDSAYLVIRNKAQDAILVVNDLLRAGTDVWMLTEFAQGGRVGDFMVARADLTDNAALAGRRIDTTGFLNEVPETATQLVKTIALVQQGGPGAGQGLMLSTRYIISRLLGFDIYWAQSVGEVIPLLAGNPNIVVAPNALNAATQAHLNNNNIPFVIFGGGGGAFDAMFGTGAAINAANHPGHTEGWFRGSFSATNALTAHYNRKDSVHSWGARTWTALPAGTVALTRTNAGAWDDVFLGGWFFNAAARASVLGRYLAYTGTTLEGTPGTIFGNNPTRWAHIHTYHNLIGTAMLMHTAGIPTDASRPFASVTEATLAMNERTVALDWHASEVTGNTATVTERWVKFSADQHILPFNADTAEADGWVSVTGDADISFPAAHALHWFAVNSDGDTHQGYFLFGAI